MNLIALIAFLTSFAFTGLDNDVEIKSFVSTDKTTVYVSLGLPTSAKVSFALADEEGDLKHHWTGKLLERGRHQLSLPLPSFVSGKYELLIHVGDDQYEQLLYVP